MNKNIVVSKFGGSSVADFPAMVRSAGIVLERQSKVALVSATFSTTDQLIKMAELASSDNWAGCEEILFNLKERHYEIASQLKDKSNIVADLELYFNELEAMLKGINLIKESSLKAMDQVLSFGERVSSLLFCEVLKDMAPNKKFKLIDARDFIKTDSQFSKALPNISKIAEKTQDLIDCDSDIIYITQGFIGSDDNNVTTTLGRGGSDYSASLIGEAINATVIEIWTDVAGIATTDPRICPNALWIGEISFDEASEMAHYGAKVLHPTTMQPAMRKNIPIFVGSSLDCNAGGSWIRNDVANRPYVRAITKRSRQNLLTIKTPKMLNVHGFMAKIFDIFARYHISVDCVTTSEISVAVTVDEKTLNNQNLLGELKKLGQIEQESGYALISLIGNNMLDKAGMAKDIFNAIDNVNIRMMSFGASSFNFNFLVKEEMSDQCITRLHQKLIEENYEASTTW
jgi:aspartate kinase